VQVVQEDLPALAAQKEVIAFFQQLPQKVEALETLTLLPQHLPEEQEAPAAVAAM